MIWLILGSLFLGMLIGKLGMPVILAGHLDLISNMALYILLFTIGLDLGQNKEAWVKIKGFGYRILLLPLGIALGSILGALAICLLINFPFNYGAAVGAGFGWYSLSGVLLKELVNVELGTIAFLANVFRELMAVIIIPFIALHLGGITAVAPGGATSMDTTLPIITKTAGVDVAVMAFISGAVLSGLVPILVPLLVNLPI
ncbi:MAG: lysine exporter LysO family protein [Clostridia bacterium]|nr:lysine exporter LysO family protein [Clostridia bacterium]